MPHVTVKLVRGKSEDQKTRLAEQITRDVVNILNYGEEAVCVAFEEVEPQVGQRKFISPRFKASGTKSTRSRATTRLRSKGLNYEHIF